MRNQARDLLAIPECLDDSIEAILINNECKLVTFPIDEINMSPYQTTGENMHFLDIKPFMEEDNSHRQFKGSDKNAPGDDLIYELVCCLSHRGEFSFGH
jgi:hypothetical protein